MIKHKPLSIQIWLIFGMTMILSLLLMSMIPWLISSLLAPDIYTYLENAQQELVLEQASANSDLSDLVGVERSGRLYYGAAIYHMIIYSDGRVDAPTIFPVNLISQIRGQIESNSEEEFPFAARVDEANIYYVASIADSSSGEAYLVSYMWNIFHDEEMKGLFYRFIIIVGFIFLICLIPALLLARYISRPLVTLENHVRQLADRNWHEPIMVNRKDEIGSLGASIEKMRQRLIQQDRAQQSFLQNISHELKTPVMVIRSYAQSISDGIFPRGDLASTVRVIDEESERLEKRIQDLLYLTKIDYLSTHEPIEAVTELSSVLHDVISRMRRRRSELTWEIELVKADVNGLKEQWTVVFENLLDNQIRYAADNIIVTAALTGEGKEPDKIRIRLWNDGPPIDEEVMERLFERFSRGPDGQFGLGLSIVQRLVWLNKGRIWAANEEEGVAFYLEIPLNETFL